MPPAKTRRKLFQHSLDELGFLHTEEVCFRVICRRSHVMPCRIEAGRLRPVDSTLVARFALGMFLSLVLPALRGIEPPPSPERRRVLAETMISQLLDGISIRDNPA